MFAFSKTPTAQDYRALAQHLRLTSRDQMHTDLWKRHEVIAQALSRMAAKPECLQHQSVYQALRLFVW